MALNVQRKEESESRLRIFTGIVLAILGLLTLQLVNIQLLETDEYEEEALSNAVRPVRVRPARGYIYDRRGDLMVDNETTYTLRGSTRYFDPADLPLVAELLDRPLEEVEAKWEAMMAYSPNQTQDMFTDIPFSAFVRLKENAYRLPGLFFEENQRRRYHGEARAAHVLGYVREISESQLDQLSEQGEYRQGDMVGIAGVEREYESILRGQPGRRMMLVNKYGMEVASYEGGTQDRPPVSGYELHLTIDAGVQALAERAFVNKRGGLVAIDPRDGGIIAMVSAPDYDPEALAGRISQSDYDYIFRNPGLNPAFNRATQMGQPPGSTFKPFMAAVALQEGAIGPDETVSCPGGVNVSGRFFSCMGVHGQIDVRTAIQRSCNSFFYRMMLRLDLNRWAQYARAFGMGTLAPLDFPNQEAALIPDSAYFDRVFPAGYYESTTVNLGIGQGNMLLTPLQLARYVTAIANGGTLHAPHLVREQVNPETGERIVPARARSRPVPVSAENLAIVREGMVRVVEIGTARASQIDGIPFAGKTGTVQNPQGRDHSMFVGYAPAENPQIVVAVMVENGGYGSSAAAPIASLAMEQFLRGYITRPAVLARALGASSENLFPDAMLEPEPPEGRRPRPADREVPETQPVPAEPAPATP